MKLSFKELSIEPSSYEGSFNFTDGDLQVAVKSYSADILPTDEGLYADIRFDYSYKAPCDRCLEETESFGNERSGVQIMHQPEEMKDEAELGDDDMGIIYISEDEIDLDDIVRQEVAYHLPVRMVCGEDCKGLCPECGANLNLGKCECDGPVDPRWASLKGLKK